MDYADLNKNLDKSEKMVDGVYFEIIAEPQSSGEKVHCFIKPEPKDVDFICGVNKNVETFKERVDRIKKLQEMYTKLWAKTTEKLKQFKEEYKNKNYKIILHKRKADIKEGQEVKTNLDKDGEKSNGQCSSASTVVVGKRKTGSSVDGHQSKRHRAEKYPKIKKSFSGLLNIGARAAEDEQRNYEAAATNDQLDQAFFKQILASNILSENQLSAFLRREGPSKQQLDPRVARIIYLAILYVMKRAGYRQKK